MELKFKEFNSYKHLTEKDLKSDYYKPEYGFDLSLLPTLSLQEQLAPFILERGNMRASKYHMSAFQSILILLPD